MCSSFLPASGEGQAGHFCRRACSEKQACHFNRRASPPFLSAGSEKQLVGGQAIEETYRHLKDSFERVSLHYFSLFVPVLWTLYISSVDVSNIQFAAEPTKVEYCAHLTELVNLHFPFPRSDYCSM